jgi:hypothetical protein
VSDQSAEVCGEPDLVACFDFIDVRLVSILERTRVAAKIIAVVVAFPGHVILRVFADILVVLGEIAVVDKVREKNSDRRYLGWRSRRRRQQGAFGNALRRLGETLPRKKDPVKRQR